MNESMDVGVGEAFDYELDKIRKMSKTMLVSSIRQSRETH